MIDKIQQHFGFTQMPFGRDLAPAMLHRHAAHAQAAARITWTITEKTLGVITGEVGTGKTVAARAALAGIDPTRHTVIYIGNPATGVRGIHHHIVTSLGGRPAHGTATLTAQAYDVLAGEARRTRPHPRPDHRRGPPARPRPARVHPDAHQPRHGLRRHVRRLLIGQPTLRRKIKLGVLAALDQRIAVRYHMTGMTLEETAGYLRHHLQIAGRSDTLFSDDAITLIHQTSCGYPRAVNNLAISALLAAFATGKAIVDESSARAAVTEVTTE